MQENFESKSFAVSISGEYALFTDPITKTGGQKSSYQIPTCQSLVGILEAIYWKPTFIIVPKKLRIVKQIQMQTKATNPVNYNANAKDIAVYTYLKSVEYQVEFTYVWDMNRQDLKEDRNPEKHNNIMDRHIEKGGKRPIFLGTSECMGYVKPCKFGEDAGAYDHIDLIDFGIMFHSFNYPKAHIDAQTKDKSAIHTEVSGKLQANFWRPLMKNGVITFIKPEDCGHSEIAKDYSAKIITQKIDEPDMRRSRVIKNYSAKVALPSAERDKYESKNEGCDKKGGAVT